MNKLYIPGLVWEPKLLAETISSPGNVGALFYRIRQALGNIGIEVGYMEDYKSGRSTPISLQSAIVFPPAGSSVEQYARAIESGAITNRGDLTAAIGLVCAPLAFDPSLRVYDLLGGESQFAPDLYTALTGELLEGIGQDRLAIRS